MRNSILTFLFLLLIQPINAVEPDALPVGIRIDNITQSLSQQGSFLMPLDSQNKNTLVIGNNYRIENCQNYPYHKHQNPRTGFKQLALDLQQGLEQGLQCLAGNSQAGSLHPYHERQLINLLALLENKHTKTFRCVADEMYAFAVAKSPLKQTNATPDKLTRSMSFPSIVIDTYRVSGFISGKHTPEIYRDFFKLGEKQIYQQLNGKPQKINGIHRYNNRSGLLFHEIIHWLGHEHTNISADVVFLYETCCFAGSDFISDEMSNQKFQNQACAMLKDKELWEANSYQKMRIWKYKGYNQLKRTMRSLYDK